VKKFPFKKQIIRTAIFGIMLLIFVVGILNNSEPDVSIIDEETTQETLFPEKILSFDVEILLEARQNIATITETIVYDFGNNEKHGIIRDIPTSFTPQYAENSIEIDFISVQDGEGRYWKTSESSLSNMESVRIGDPDVTISGKHTYVIKYTVDGPIGFFRENDEFYWNVTGNDWDVPIESASAQFEFIDIGATDKLTGIYSYCGSKRDTTDCSPNIKNEVNKDGSIHIQKNTVLYPGEGMTIDIEFEKGLAPTISQERIMIYWFRRFGWAILGVLLALFMYRKRIGLHARYARFRRNNSLVTQFTPGPFDPVSLGILVNNSTTKNDLGAFIVHAAIGGLLKLKPEQNGDLHIILNREIFEKSHISPAKKNLLLVLDDVHIPADASYVTPAGKMGLVFRDISKKLRKYQAERMEEFEKSLLVKKARGLVARSESQNYNTKKPKSIKFFIGIFLAINPGVFLYVFFGISEWIAFAIFVMLMNIFSILFLWMPDYTYEGFRTKRRAEGLRWYIDHAEDDRINELNKEAKTPELYEKLLPYAMVFGLEEKWSKAFAGIQLGDLSWYDGSFSDISSFGHKMSSMSSIASSSMSGAQFRSSGSGGSSSGGGSSGGGGGGGGGSSW